MLAKPQKNNAGFSMVELIIVVAVIGILSAIAAPSWDALVTRQRVRSVNSQVLQLLQTAQAEARRNRQNYTIEFDSSEDPPRFSIDLEGTDDNDKDWEPLNVEGEIKPGQIQIAVQANNDNSINSITFNHLGAVDQPVPEMSQPPRKTDGFTVTVSPVNGNIRQCVIVTTILGATRTEEGEDNCP